MFHYHKVLYKRLLRGQSLEQLTSLRHQSLNFPALARLIEAELSRRNKALRGWSDMGKVSAVRPFVATGSWPMS